MRVCVRACMCVCAHACAVCVSYTTAGRDGDLNGVPSWLTDMLQIQGLMRSLVVPTLYSQRSGINADLRDGRRHQETHVTVLYYYIGMVLVLPYRECV